MLDAAERFNAHFRVLRVEAGQFESHIGSQTLHGVDVFLLIVPVAYEVLHMIERRRAFRAIKTHDVLIAAL